MFMEMREVVDRGADGVGDGAAEGDRGGCIERCLSSAGWWLWSWVRVEAPEGFQMRFSRQP